MRGTVLSFFRLLVLKVVHFALVEIVVDSDVCVLWWCGVFPKQMGWLRSRASMFSDNGANNCRRGPFYLQICRDPIAHCVFSWCVPLVP